MQAERYAKCKSRAEPLASLPNSNRDKIRDKSTLYITNRLDWTMAQCMDIIDIRMEKDFKTFELFVKIRTKENSVERGWLKYTDLDFNDDTAQTSNLAKLLNKYEARVKMAMELSSKTSPFFQTRLFMLEVLRETISYRDFKDRVKEDEKAKERKARPVEKKRTNTHDVDYMEQYGGSIKDMNPVSQNKVARFKRFLEACKNKIKQIKLSTSNKRVIDIKEYFYHMNDLQNSITYNYFDIVLQKRYDVESNQPDSQEPN
jgi:hypothetical protein